MPPERHLADSVALRASEQAQLPNYAAMSQSTGAEEILLSDIPQRPTFTLEEILAEYKEWRFDKITLAAHLAYPPDKPFAQEFEQLVLELTSRMLQGTQELLKDIQPSDIVVRLVDRPSVNAYVTPSDRGKFEVFINRGLIEEILVAPELAQKNMCVDTLAAVVAHEVCHANFRRQYQGRFNSMPQEEYCDLLPAQMLEGAGFRPEAMSALFSILSRVSGEPGARRVSPTEPHASSPIRKEIYEKGGWESYERERRKDTIEVDRIAREERHAQWTERLNHISSQAKEERIISPIRHELLKQGFATASFDEKLTLLDTFISEHQNLIRDCSSVPILFELSDLTIAAFYDSGFSGAGYTQHPLFIKISELLYEHSDPQKADRCYLSITGKLDINSFGAFEYADAAYLSLIKARSEDEVLASLSLCEALLQYRVQPSHGRNSWAGTLLPQSTQALEKIFSDVQLEALKVGDTIPFPFALHQRMYEELLPAAYSDTDEAQTFRLLQKFNTLSGITFAIQDLLHPAPDYYQHRDSPIRQLLDGTGIGDKDAFMVSKDTGISPLFPSRSAVTDKGTFEPGTERETAFAEFIAHRGEALLAEASQLTQSTFFEFVEKNALFILPQLHPVGLLSEELTTRSHKLASVVMERFDSIMTAEPSATFRESAKELLSQFKPMRWSPLFQIYSGYHKSIKDFVDGCHVDPRHPIAQAILRDTHGLLSNAEKILALSTLHGFEGGKTGIIGKPLQEAFTSATLGEENLKALLGVDRELKPTLFIEKLTRFHTAGEALWNSTWMFKSPLNPIRRVRGHYVEQYLDQTPAESFTIENLHHLHDLCSGDALRPLARRISDLAISRAQQIDLTRLSHSEFVMTFKRLSVMGATDSSVPLQTTLQREIVRRVESLRDLSAQAAFFDDLVYPHPFSVGEVSNLWIGAKIFDNTRFRSIERVSSLYNPKFIDPVFERFVVNQLVTLCSDQIRQATSHRFDDGSEVFLKSCKQLLATFDQRVLPPTVRRQVLRGVADELLLQRKAAYLFRDNLALHSKHQSNFTFANLMMATHKNATATNIAATTTHNALVDLRSGENRKLRESLFSFLLERQPAGSLSSLTGLLVDTLRVKNLNNDYSIPEIFHELGISGVRFFSSPEDEARQREIIEYHLRSLHQRFSELDVKAKGAALSVLAVDTNPSEESFNTFRDSVLLPRILPEKGAYNELLLSGIKDYFELYSNAVHHKYMVACAILASTQEEMKGGSELTRVGLVAKSFLGAHGTAGYKLLQRIRNHPTTPQEIKDVLHNVLDETVSLPRWTVHERIAEFGPTGAESHWVGRAKAGSMCLSVPLKKADGSESFLSILHPGARIDSLYWLQNFTTIASSLSLINPALGVLAPMAQQTRRLVENETTFASSPRTQQESAEGAYTFTMDLPEEKITVASSCAPLITSEAKTHPSDFMKDSGNKEAARAHGRPLLDLVREFKEKVASKVLPPDEISRRHAILKTVALSILANEVRLAASGEAKDHDRHPGNYMVDVQKDPSTGRTVIHLNHFDFGCADLAPPSPSTLRETATALQRGIDSTSLTTMIFRPKEIPDSIASALFERGTFDPAVASLPLGLIAAIGANERVPVNGRERPLLDAKDIARAFKIGLEGATIPEELRVKPPGGLRGWLLSRAFRRIDTKGAHFLQ